MSPLTANWVTPAEDGQTCERCEGREDVLALKLIYDRPTFLCRDCLQDAMLGALDRMGMVEFVRQVTP